ncbi:hypothetical protein [Amycolatopsis alkalitolerans]|uniref:Uncharacterized protein n=1 Tax=Amycolatopsis alkalitolerans TaxID=2547244 RepID=A0A5C4LWQ2_9PSEU|nr:hypothetical protein [Amycolatopsis alkalitolerans]TNC23709.1 hypothetical protein FG385_20305 [Amycolatopsis alkalitolerans]
MSIANWAKRLDDMLTPDTTESWEETADAVVLQRIDEADSRPRPTNVATFYSEEEYERLAEEQERLWSAEGEREARGHTVRVSGLDAAADAALDLLAESKKAVAAAYEDHLHASRVLTPHVRRESGAKLRYRMVWPLLVLGEASGIWSAAISWGDIPWIAAGQALSAGLAGASAGLVGSELKRLQLARTRRRDPDSLTEDERRYERLFTGSEKTPGIVKLIGFVSVLVAALLAVAVFALRSSVEGSSSGLTYALIAFATALASGLLGYQAADEVADLLATYVKQVKRAERHHRQLAGDTAIADRAEAVEAARSTQAEAALRGQAASKRVASLSFRILRRNPGAVGHGYPSGDASGVIGRRARRNGGAV